MARAPVRRSDDHTSPAYRAICTLQGKWILHIVRVLLGGPMGFNELARTIGGCNPATLAQRLEDLVSRDLVSKRIKSTMPPRTCYSLSPAGRGLAAAIREIERWGQRYLDEAPVPARPRKSSPGSKHSAVD